MHSIFITGCGISNSPTSSNQFSIAFFIQSPCPLLPGLGELPVLPRCLEQRGNLTTLAGKRSATNAAKKSSQAKNSWDPLVEISCNRPSSHLMILTIPSSPMIPSSGPNTGRIRDIPLACVLLVVLVSTG